MACVGGVIFLIITGGCGYYCKKRKNDHVKVLNDGHETGKEMEISKLRIATPTDTDVFNTNNNHVDITNFSVSDGNKHDLNSEKQQMVK